MTYNVVLVQFFYYHPLIVFSFCIYMLQKINQAFIVEINKKPEHIYLIIVIQRVIAAYFYAWDYFYIPVFLFL